MLPQFIKIFPHEYKRVLGLNTSEQQYVPSADTQQTVASGLRSNG